MKVAYIHSDKKIGTGAHYINDLIVTKLKENGVEIQSYYPHFILTDTPVHFKGINNILFFNSLLEKRDKILKCDIIQGTTYTPMAFLQFDTPVISHFGSTTIGFLKAVPKTKNIEPECAEIFYDLKKRGILREIDLKTRRPLKDIATIEKYTASKSDYVIATSEIVKKNLIDAGISPDKIVIIYNAIEDYWFTQDKGVFNEIPKIVFLGRLGEDPFTLKLKGADRLIHLYNKFPEAQKLSLIMTNHEKLIEYFKEIPNNQVESNVLKDTIPEILAKQMGSIMLITSRYEGFSLSLIEGMSQGLIPVSFPVGVIPEIIENGVNGYIVNTLEEAEEKIKLLLKDTELRRKLTVNAIKTSERFKSDILAKEMIDLYKKILTK